MHAYSLRQSRLLLVRADRPVMESDRHREGPIHASYRHHTCVVQASYVDGSWGSCCKRRETGMSSLESPAELVEQHGNRLSRRWKHITAPGAGPSVSALAHCGGRRRSKPYMSKPLHRACAAGAAGSGCTVWPKVRSVAHHWTIDAARKRG